MSYTNKQFSQAIEDIDVALDEHGVKTDIHEAMMNYLKANKDDFLDCYNLGKDEDEIVDESEDDNGQEPW